MKNVGSFKLIVVMCALVAGAGIASAAQTWDAAADFDLNNNPASLTPWSYGGGVGEDFQLATLHMSANGLTGWTVNTNTYPGIQKNTTGAAFVYSPNGENGYFPEGCLTMSPDWGTPVPGVVRWTAPFAGEFEVDTPISMYRFSSMECRRFRRISLNKTARLLAPRLHWSRATRSSLRSSMARISQPDMIA